MPSQRFWDSRLVDFDLFFERSNHAHQGQHRAERRADAPMTKHSKLSFWLTTGKRRTACPAHRRSEDQLHSQLELPRIARGRDFVKDAAD
jgi:hypothetical protein